MSNEISIAELKGIIRRRRNVFLYTFIGVFSMCLIIAFVLPSMYESKVMIVVENQEIPEEYVKSTTRSYISERLELLERKILSYTKLLEIVKENNLYAELDSNGEKVSRFRKDTTLETIDVSVGDQRRTSATIAFTLAYINKSPEKAKIVADTLGGLFVEEDQARRKKRASATTVFLERELEDLRRLVKMNEEKISRFKAENIHQLPGSTGIFQQTILRMDQELDGITTRIRTLKEKTVYLKSQLANIDRLVPILTENGKVASNPNNRLKYLRLQLIRMRANLSDKHPDIIRLKSEIAKLEAQGGGQDTTSEKIDRLTMVEKEIAELKATYGDKHPEIIRLTNEAELLRKQINEAPSNQNIEEDRTDNPEYMNIKAQIIVAESEINALTKEKENLERKRDDYQKKLEIAPFIDEEYNSLTLDYDNARKEYNEVANKLHSARIAQEMDESESGERFRIEHPAHLPDKPSKPNRVFIILLGFALGIGGGTTLAALLEGMDSSVKEAKQLESIAGFPVLAAVSYVDSPFQRRRRRNRRLMLLTIVLLVIMTVSFFVNLLVMPIGDLWDKFEDRLFEIGVPIERESIKLQTIDQS
ncbi:lipopolysaccharide biosynthesis protein [Desulfosarcina variabilis str. Montpellier]|uniref:hypothetical protein n=1 Tax=Desulfosarcina variabilis TaxID=2300 RepID=UPI003AFB620B